MDKEKLLKAGILTALAAGVGYFAYRFVKETKLQIKEMEEANAAQTQELLDTIKLRDEQLALAEGVGRNATLSYSCSLNYS